MTPETVSHYRILSKLGAGGMGEVYLAEDLNLGRRVALKLLPARFMQDAERVRRFAQEARTASTLNHPNILTIYEIGQTAGDDGEAHYIAMEFVEGQTLRQRLMGRRLKLEDALDIAVQIVSALVAAHGAGITHRDVKPENIMLRQDGYVKVLDFGLAKLTESPAFLSQDPSITQAETVDDPFADLYATAQLQQLNNTSPGVILGTINYMSPEQARGQKVDARTDIFSLGIVLYELLAGRTPFAGASTGDVMVAILDRTPPPLARYAPDTPEELEWIVAKALAKDRDERYQSSKSMLADLKRLQKRVQMGLSGVATLTDESRYGDQFEAAPSSDFSHTRSTGNLEATSGQGRSGSQQLPRPIDSLAVLPFVSASTDADAAYLSEGIPESLVLNLSRLPQLRVMAWSTVARWRGKEADPLQVGRELGVRAVFAARLYQFGEKLMIKAELVDVADGAQIWGGQYQRQLDNLFTIEQEISQEICEHLRLRLNEEERARLTKRYTENAEAYQAYLQGRYFWHQRTAKGLRKALESFSEAIKLDPEYALAYAGVADCYCLISIYGSMPPKAVLPRAKSAALRAIEIDEGLAEAHTSLAAVLCWYDWDWERSEREFKRALELNPSYMVAHHWYGSVLLAGQGRFDEALAEELTARELEPLSLVVNSNLGFICYQAHRYENAVKYLLETLEIDEQFIYARFHLGLTYAQLKRHDEAIVELQRALELSGGGALIKAALGYAYANAGRRTEALAILAELQAAPQHRDTSPFYLATIYAGLGETAQALQALNAACEECYNWMIWLRSEPIFLPLHAEPQFQELLQRLRLA
ncbi:MAG: protein kinase [Acidobacteria bacterium]|nr:protein kinase [Acidobacteriota bacterium]